MLSAIFNDRLSQMMAIRIQEISRENQEAFAKKSAEAALRGHVRSGYTLGLYQERRGQDIQKRVTSIVEFQKRLISAMRIPYSTTLALELKRQVESWVTPEWCEKSLESDPIGSEEQLKSQFRAETFQRRENALAKASIEIDLMADELQAKPNPPQVPSKELDQKFKILLSPEQIQKDFDELKHALLNGPIALLFVDLDNFKALNTKHTEPKIDKTLLPDAMRLIESIVKFRGEAAKHGGDEYVVMLPNHDTMEAMCFSEKIRQTFEAHTFVIDGDSVKITVSIGVAMWPMNGQTYDEVVTLASAAKQEAKGNKNSVVLARETSLEVLPLPKSGLSPGGQKLAKFLNDQSKTAEDGDPTLGPEEILAGTLLSAEELTVAADELRYRGLVRGHIDGSKIGFRYLQPNPSLFFQTDPTLKGWDPRQDARTIAVTSLKMEQDSISLAEIGEKLKWAPRRLNPAAIWLELGGFARFTKAMGTSPYRFKAMTIIPATKRLASEGI